jgi:hypothetical protein
LQNYPRVFLSLADRGLEASSSAAARPRLAQPQSRQPGPNNAAGARNSRNLFTFTDGLQLSRGTHQISLGAWFQKLQDNENTASRRLGVANFASLTTFIQGTLSATGFQIVPTTTELGFRSWFGAWYAEDSMRLRSNLTLRLGLRHEFTNGWNEKFGRAANYVTDANGVLRTDPLVGKSAFTGNNAKWLLGPRAALAWDPFGKGKTAVRAGFGMYYTLIDNLSFLLNSLPPANGSVTYPAGPLTNVPLADHTRGSTIPRLWTWRSDTVQYVCASRHRSCGEDSNHE